MWVLLFEVDWITYSIFVLRQHLQLQMLDLDLCFIFIFRVQKFYIFRFLHFEITLGFSSLFFFILLESIVVICCWNWNLVLELYPSSIHHPSTCFYIHTYIHTYTHWFKLLSTCIYILKFGFKILYEFRDAQNFNYRNYAKNYFTFGFCSSSSSSSPPPPLPLTTTTTRVNTKLSTLRRLRCS